MQNAKFKMQKTLSRISFCILPFALCILACARKEPLTEAKAKQILGQYEKIVELVYAEVPQRVWWSPRAPKDDYDEKALRTLRNLERAGLLTITEKHDGDMTSFTGHPTPKGFPILGTAPSLRGPCFRAQICEKRYDGVRNFVRHPNEPTVGYAELIWHYSNPTPLYDLFETKINKPINRPFASQVSFYYKDHDWHFAVTVRKTDPDRVPSY
jgi:hypothetical protein